MTSDIDGLRSGTARDARADTAAPVPSSEYVQSLARGLSVIRAFDAANPRRTLSDVARATDLTRATARRFLLTLAELGYVRSDGTLFWLTPRVLELGYSYLSSLTLPEIAEPHLQDLSEEVNESSSVSILDGTEVVYVARVAIRRIMTVGISIGTRLPAWATSMGRVLLADLPDDELAANLEAAAPQPFTERTLTDPASLIAEIRSVGSRGYALVDQELENGLRSLAAPVRSADGRVVAALNISTPAFRYTDADIQDTLLPALLRTTEAIQRDLAAVRR
ncbi:IclR family transcriptional regulator domain-containing protein [Tsukamurella spumae]|uniref:Glycerol operon regulatory protein n=1 Tax=Tsukamurella spumae TaxID=44753 RepID=A0A846WZY4_9ACTN|nr:IclR family transcriptional regulator C-terminal domain-containing protein [Tsukamurella spumae]NKY17825.1 helix-turn-helix domain-containing protein [Tsukamurella spumae]